MLEWSFYETESKAGAVGPQRPGETGARVKSMHEDIPEWYDCCSCEAEPYWIEAMGEEATGEPDCDGGGTEP